MTLSTCPRWCNAQTHPEASRGAALHSAPVSMPAAAMSVEVEWLEQFAGGRDQHLIHFADTGDHDGDLTADEARTFAQDLLRAVDELEQIQATVTTS